MVVRQEPERASYEEFRRELDRSGPEWPENSLLVSSVDSTNLLARRLVSRLVEDDENVPDFCIIGFHQKGGRGREGRTWWSPPGAGLYATRVVTLAAEEIALLPLRVPLALCQAMDRFVPGRCRIKWPNDLLIGGRKLGGVLIEAVRRSSPRIEVLIGFGINHSHSTEEMPSLQATSLGREMAVAPSLAAVASAAIAELESALATPLEPSLLLGGFRARLAHLAGDLLRVQIGEERLEGRFLGVDESGFLRLEVAGGERRIAAGEVVQ